MQTQLRVDFFGTVEWFLDKYYDSYREDSQASVHLSQRAYSRQLIAAHQISKATPTETPYRSGHTINDIPQIELPTLEQYIIIGKYQSLISSLLWLVYVTHPDLCIDTSLLVQYKKH
jgi:hypothetical protein